MSKAVKGSFFSDIGSSVLDLCAKNAQMNRDLYMYDDGETTQNVILVRELDWTKSNPKQGIYKCTLFFTMIATNHNFTSVRANSILKSINV